MNALRTATPAELLTADEQRLGSMLTPRTMHDETASVLK